MVIQSEVFRAGRARHRIARLLALLAVACVIAACQRPPAEQQVRAAIETAATAARSNDTSGVLAVVSDDFTGNDGDLDRHGLRQLLALRALRQDKTGVLVGPIHFEHAGARIIATFMLTLTGGGADSLLPDHAAVYAMTTAWRRERSHWRCYNAKWSQQD